MLLTIKEGWACAALAGGRCRTFAAGGALPQVDYPTISVSASLPGASPTPWPPRGDAAGTLTGRDRRANEITSSSSLGNTRITLQFDLSRTVDSAAHDAGRHQRRAHDLPTGMPAARPTAR